MPFPGLAKRELEYIALRCQGARPTEIAALWGCGKRTVFELGNRVMTKAGVSGGAALVEWARGWGFDKPLGPEQAHERPYPGMPKQRGREPIKMGRIRRATFSSVR